MAIDGFQLTSDYPVDMVAGMFTLSASPASYDYIDLSVPHGLPFTPLVIGLWSTSPTGIPSYPYGGGPAFSYGNYYDVAAYADSSNIITANQNNTGSGVTIYHSILAFAPSSYVGNVVSTEGAGNSFIFDSDDTFGKLVADGEITLAQNATGTITHNLGFTPHAYVWIQNTSGSVVGQLVRGGVDSSAPYTYLTTSNLVIVNNNINTAPYKFYYRIYADV